MRKIIFRGKRRNGEWVQGGIAPAYYAFSAKNMAEIARQQYDLDQANATLEAERAKLTEAEQQIMPALQ